MYLTDEEKASIVHERARRVVDRIQRTVEPVPNPYRLKVCEEEIQIVRECLDELVALRAVIWTEGLVGTKLQ